MKYPINMVLADFLTRARQARGLTQAELSSRSGVSRPTINYIEVGRANPTVGILSKILSALDLSLKNFGDYAEENPPKRSRGRAA